MSKHVCGQMPAETTPVQHWPDAPVIMIRRGSWTNTLTCVHDVLAVRDESDGGYDLPSMGLRMTPGDDCIDEWDLAHPLEEAIAMAAEQPGQFDVSKMSVAELLICLATCAAYGAQNPGETGKGDRRNLLSCANLAMSWAHMMADGEGDPEEHVRYDHDHSAWCLEDCTATLDAAAVDQDIARAAFLLDAVGQVAFLISPVALRESSTWPHRLADALIHVAAIALAWHQSVLNRARREV